MVPPGIHQQSATTDTYHPDHSAMRLNQCVHVTCKADQMNTIPSAPALNVWPVLSNQGNTSKEVITAPDASVTRHTMSLGPDKSWDIYIRKDGDGIKVDKPLW